MFLLGEYGGDMPINKLAPQDAFGGQGLHHKESGSKLDTTDFHMKCDCTALAEAPSTRSYNVEGRGSENTVSLPVFW
jgi:hypothetical protein